MSNTSQRKRLAFEELEPRIVLSTTTFVQGLYRDVLHREGNFLTEVLPQVANLALGRVSRDGLVQGFLNSPERLGLDVGRLYKELLDRAADPGGLAANVQALLSGLSLRDIAENLLNSTEFQNAHPNDTAFIQGLFENALHREAGAADLAIWKTNISIGGRSIVIDGVLDSAERGNVVTGNFYAEFLDRTASQEEKLGHVQGAISGRFDQLAQAFVLSLEFDLKANDDVSNGVKFKTEIEIQIELGL